MTPLLLRPGRRPMFPPLHAIVPEDDGLVALGADLEPDTLVEAYRKGLFPWDGRWPAPWYSPDPRMILEPSGFKVSDSLAKRARKQPYQLRYDTAFDAVMKACAGTRRRGQSWACAPLRDANHS